MSSRPINPLAPRKHFGQNFLMDPRVKDRIVASCHLHKDEEIIEIGPGLGHLTEYLLPHVKKIYAIEKDRRYREELASKFSSPKLTTIEADVLDFDFANLPSGLKVIGNLPYYISTPIIERLLQCPDRFREGYFTVQKEFADRLAAKPDSKDYGSLSCYVQYYADVQILFKISPAAFKPIPKVTSAFIKLTFRPPVHAVKKPDQLFHLIRTAFQQRRKKISNSIKKFFINENAITVFKACGLTGEERAENLSLEKYIDLAEKLAD